MKKTIYEKIEERTKEAVAQIEKEAEIESAKIKSSLLNKATKDVEHMTKEAHLLKAKTIDQKKALYELERKQALLKIQNDLIQETFEKALKELENISGKALLDFVYNKLRKEHLKGHETLEVNPKDYDKFLSALSSKPKSALVELDLLNALMGNHFHLKLSNKKALIDNGFLVIGEDYDINFSYSSLLETIKKQQEKTISKQLFD